MTNSRFAKLSLLFPALALMAIPLSAQVVRGVVIDQDIGSPLEGVMVIVRQPGGDVDRRALTGADGGFVLRVAEPGSYVITVERIGYESLTTPAFDVPPEGVARRVEVPVNAVQLSGLDVTVSNERRCTARPEQSAGTARVWEEARKALEAAVWTQNSGVYGYMLKNVERKLDSENKVAWNEKFDFVRQTGQAPYESRPATELIEEGFSRSHPDRTQTYYVPDANVMLSEDFLDTHCFRVAAKADSLIGLAFQPVRQRDVSDIQGMLWLDEETAALSRLDFEYVDRPDTHDLGEAGGSVTFAGLPNGTWIVRDWSVHMPLLGYRGDGRKPSEVVGYLEEGGIVWQVTDRSGTVLLETQTATVSGSVVDSTGAKPIGNALVRATSGEGEARTDYRGAFSLSGLVAGPKRLEVTHVSRERLGLPPVRFNVEVEEGQVAEARVQLPPLREGLDEACEVTDPRDDNVGIVIGTVLRSGKPAAGAGITLKWVTQAFGDFDLVPWAAPPQPSGDRLTWTAKADGSGDLATTLDERGVFMLCGVPKGSQMRVEARLEGTRPAVGTITMVPDLDMAFVRLVLRDEPNG